MTPDEQRRHWREASARYRATHPDARAIYLQTERGRASTKASEERERVSGRKRARNRLIYAVRIGLVSKTPCKVCSSLRVEAHHHQGYDDPLVVTWLCRQHHMEFHRVR